MKPLMLITTLSLLSMPLVGGAEVIRLSEPVATSASSETFGAALNPQLPVQNMAQLASDPDAALGKPFQLRVRVAKVCQKKGCFFIAQEGEHVLRVEFKDYGFFIPTDSMGKVVTLNGELVKKQLSAEQVEHYKADLRAPGVDLAAGVSYEIVASAIEIPTQS